MTRTKRGILLLGLFILIGGGVIIGRAIFLSPPKIASLTLPALSDGQPAFDSQNMLGKIWLLNIWASWCVPCRAEHPILLRLAGEGAIIVGLNYQDTPAEAKAWLNDFGNPYQIVAADKSGEGGQALGIYGVPETFVIDSDGGIRYRHIGHLTEADLAEIVRPLLVRLRQADDSQ